MRLSKLQKSSQEGWLTFYGLQDEFKPDVMLFKYLMDALIAERKALATVTVQLADEKAKPISRILLERCGIKREKEDANSNIQG